MTRPSRFEGTIGRTLAESDAVVRRAAAPGRRRAERRGHPPRRHRLRPVRVLRLRHRHAEHRRASPPSGLQFTNFHVTPLCSPTRAVAAHRPSTSTRSACASLVELPHRLPEPCSATSRTTPPPSAEVLRDEGYATFCARQVAPRADGARARPPARSTSGRWPARLRPLLRIPRGRDRPVPPRARLRQPPDRPAGRSRRRLPPQRGPGRPGAADDRHDSEVVRPDRPFFTYLAVRRHPRAAPGAGRATWRSTAGAFDEGWDVVRERWFARQLELGRRPAPAPSSRRATPASSRGTTCPRTSSGWRAGCRRRSPRSSTTPTTRSVGSSTGSRDLGELDNTV